MCLHSYQMYLYAFSQQLVHLSSALSQESLDEIKSPLLLGRINCNCNITSTDDWDWEVSQVFSLYSQQVLVVENKGVEQRTWGDPSEVTSQHKCPRLENKYAVPFYSLAFWFLWLSSVSTPPPYRLLSFNWRTLMLPTLLNCFVHFRKIIKCVYVWKREWVDGPSFQPKEPGE